MQVFDTKLSFLSQFNALKMALNCFCSEESLRLVKKYFFSHDVDVKKNVSVNYNFSVYFIESLIFLWLAKLLDNFSRSNGPNISLKVYVATRIFVFASRFDMKMFNFIRHIISQNPINYKRNFQSILFRWPHFMAFSL